jgi:hypothetical protein
MAAFIRVLQSNEASVTATILVFMLQSTACFVANLFHSHGQVRLSSTDSLNCLERLGVSGHELNPGSFERDWITRANSKVRSRL